MEDKKWTCCNHCNQAGHTRDVCFQLDGGKPEWFKKERCGSVVANVAEMLNTADEPMTLTITIKCYAREYWILCQEFSIFTIFLSLSVWSEK